MDALNLLVKCSSANPALTLPACGWRAFCPHDVPLPMRRRLRMCMRKHHGVDEAWI